MNQLNRLSFRTKVSILVFLTTFTFFMGFILIEDLIILAPLIKGTEGWDGTRRAARLGFAFCFSILSAMITAFSFNIFYSSLRNLINFIQNWREESQEDDIQITRNDEIGNLIRSLQIIFYQEKEKADQRAEVAVQTEKQRISAILQADQPRAKLKKIPGLDISLFPNASKNPNSDCLQIIPTKEGCFGILGGFESAGILESAFKTRLNAMISVLQNLPDKKGTTLLKILTKSLDQNPTSLLNLSLFHLDQETGELNYLSWQSIPLMVLGEYGLKELEKGFGNHAPLGNGLEESYRLDVQENEFLILFSDRILKPIHLTGKQFVAELNRRLFEDGSSYANTRELTLAIANLVSRRYGRKALDNLGLIIVRRSSRSHLSK
jgi:Arg-Lys translocation region protein phosphatase